MTTATLSQTEAIKEAIANLPPGESRLWHDVAWEDYQQLTEECTEWPGKRLTYDRGRLEIISPLPKHERYKELLLRLVDRLSQVLGVEVESLGSTTFDEEWMRRGVEPDTCFYIANADAVIGKDRLDLNVDPPPDIAVEIDISNPSIRKLPIYEEMRVPEVWSYDEKRLCLYLLGNTGYEESSHSRSFPVVTSAVLTEALEQSKTQGQSAVLRTFRVWLQTQVP